MKHFPIGPSSLSRLVNCPASLGAAQGVSNDSEYSSEGDLAHAACEKANKSGTEVTLESVGGDLELLRACQTFVGQVSEIRQSKNIVQEWVEATLAHSTIEDFGGTSDYAALYTEGSGVVLHVVDFKAGVGVPVTAKNNLQVRGYASILRDYCVLDPTVYRGTVVQPRSFAVDPIQHAEYAATDIDSLERIIAEIKQNNHFEPGDHCRFCPLAKKQCKALADRIELIRDTALNSTPNEQQVATMLHFHSMATVIRNFLKDCETGLIYAGRTGVAVPGYKVADKKSNRAWLGDEKRQQAIARELADLGVNFHDATQSSLKSPKQIEDLLRSMKVPKPERDEFLGARTERHVTGQKLVPVTTNDQPFDTSVPFDTQPEQE